MKLTRHNGRSGKNGVYNPKHNDRRFNIDNSDHIDREREKQNIYWDCYRGFTQEPALGCVKDDWDRHSFSEIELMLELAKQEVRSVQYARIRNAAAKVSINGTP